MRKFITIAIFVLSAMVCFSQNNVDSIKMDYIGDDSIRFIVFVKLPYCQLVDSICYSERLDTLSVTAYHSEEIPQCDCEFCQVWDTFYVERNKYKYIEYTAMARTFTSNGYIDYFIGAVGSYSLADGNNIQSFDMRSSWSVIETNLFDDSYQVVRAYKIDGDTVISNSVYGKVLCDNIYYCSVRESEGNVYAKFPDIDTELLVYDFNWNPNDTLYHQVAYDLDSLYVQAILGETIDSILLINGRYYKCIRNLYGEATIINGIGDTRGFFFSTFELPSNGCQFSLLRFNIGNELVYCNSEYDNCNENNINEITTNGAMLSIFPNPASNSISIDIEKEYTDLTIEIIDETGRVVYSRNDLENPISLDNFVTGIYFVRLQVDGDVTTKKIVVE